MTSFRRSPHPAHTRATKLTALGAHAAILCWLSITGWIGSASHRARAARSDDRGEALAAAAIAVGMVIIAGIVIAVLKTKSQDIAQNVCTNADPSTC
jgi:threonine/homoserine/homoserine lactone efflux protein